MMEYNVHKTLQTSIKLHKDNIYQTNSTFSLKKNHLRQNCHKNLKFKFMYRNKYIVLLYSKYSFFMAHFRFGILYLAQYRKKVSHPWPRAYETENQFFCKF